VRDAIEIANGRKIEIRNPMVLADVVAPEEFAARIAAVTLERLGYRSMTAELLVAAGD
jgi:hypothetical protein